MSTSKLDFCILFTFYISQYQILGTLKIPIPDIRYFYKIVRYEPDTDIDIITALICME